MQSEIRGSVGILGFGVDGQGIAEWLARQTGVERVVVFDDTLSDERIRGLEDKRIVRGDSMQEIDVLFRSPGFPLTYPLIAEAKKKGIPITSSTRQVLGNFQGVTVGITGSNGKTTCTALIEEFLKAEYGEERGERGGNDGGPRLDLMTTPFDMRRSVMLSSPSKSEGVSKHVGGATQGDTPFLVLELSSFQLIDSEYSPNVAVVLNITPNHLDWHKDMEEYAEAKRQIVVHQKSHVMLSGEQASDQDAMRGVEARRDVAILNQNDEIVKTFAKGIKSEVRWFMDDILWDQVRVKSHPDTICAAVTAARALKVSEENILKVLREFKGVPHRLEFVRELDGIKYYNDSSCTTPESAIVACNAFPKGSLTILLGGRDKKMDFSKLYAVIKKRDVVVVSYGEMAETFRKNIPKSYPLKAISSFEEAIATARSMERPNVVLSPACASFDMFKNAKERGERFMEIVQ